MRNWRSEGGLLNHTMLFTPLTRWLKALIQHSCSISIFYSFHSMLVFFWFAFFLCISHLFLIIKKKRQSLLLLFLISLVLGNQKITPVLLTCGKDIYCIVTMHQYTVDIILSKKQLKKSPLLLNKSLIWEAIKEKSYTQEWKLWKVKIIKMLWMYTVGETDLAIELCLKKQLLLKWGLFTQSYIMIIILNTYFPIPGPEKWEAKNILPLPYHPSLAYCSVWQWPTFMIP